MSDAAQRRRRRRHNPLLSTYYGVGADSPSGSGSGSGLGDPLDVDSKAFEAGMYVKELLDSHGLNSLLAKNAELASQVASLDSDMQTLVYENYSKFITATDTVQDLKAKMEGMDAELDSLAAKMDGISGLSNAIDDKLAGNRSAIHNLATASQALDKLLFLTRLPSRIRKALDVGAHKAAVRYFAAYGHVVDANADHPRLAPVAASMESLKAETKDLLRSRLAESASMDDLGHVMDMLMDLGESVDDLRASYLAKQEEALAARLQALNPELLEEKMEHVSTGSIAFPLLNSIRVLHAGFLSPLLDFVSAYRALFLDKRNADAAGTQGLLSVIANLFTPFFRLVKDLVSVPVSTGLVLEVLEKLSDDYRVLEDALPPSAGVADRVDEITAKVLHVHVDGVFARLRASLDASIGHAADAIVSGEAGDSVPAVVEETLSVISSALTGSLGSLRPLLSSDMDAVADHKDLIINSSQANIQQTLICLREKLEASSSRALESTDFPPPLTSRADVVPLVLAGVAKTLGEETVPDFVRRTLAILRVHPGEVVLDASPIQDDLRQCVMGLISEFVQSASCTLSSELGRVYHPAQAGEWCLSQSLPWGTSVSPWVDDFVEGLKTRLSPVRALFPDEQTTLAERQADGEDIEPFLSQDEAGPGSGNEHRRGPSSFASMTLMFEEKAQLGSVTLEPRSNVISLVLSASVVKSWVEAIRLLSLSRPASRSILYDAVQLAHVLPSWVDDDTLLRSLFKDLSSSLSNRTH